MFNSIPVSALKLGIDFQGYEELAQNIKRVSLIPQHKWYGILERADKELNFNQKDISKLLLDMLYERKLFKIAGLKYHKNPPKGLFKTALTDYLLREKI